MATFVLAQEVLEFLTVLNLHLYIAQRSQKPTKKVWNVLQHVKAIVAEFERLGLLEEIKPHDLTVLLTQ